MKPTPIQISLDDITTDYAVFEKDQVLTADQLNGVTDYLDDQARLTRIKLIGIGIVCGLRVSLSESEDGTFVTVTEGVGVTSDGDLLYFESDTDYDTYRLYDSSNPFYSPFYIMGEKGERPVPLTLYELIQKGTTVDGAVALSQFATETQSSLDKMVAVLFAETYVKEDDLCTGTDCDNLGDEYISTIKLLLIDRASIGGLIKNLPTAEAGNALSQLVANRAVIPVNSNITSTTALSEIYQEANESMYDSLHSQFEELWSWSGFLRDVFMADPTATWLDRLETIKNRSSDPKTVGFQYYYDFFKDLVATWNSFRDLLLSATENWWCCPPKDAFPKHLLLGNVVPGANLDENRTEFYPSPILGNTSEELRHAAFLAKKLDAMIKTFEVPSAEDAQVVTIGVTPSAFEDIELEKRAIPFYYKIDTVTPIFDAWNFGLSEFGMGKWNYSFNAAGKYGAQGAAAIPLYAQIGPFWFYRVEGHVGGDVETVKFLLATMIKVYNLPFTVQAVQLAEADPSNELVFSTFQSVNPSMEHFAGVTRGGTFILVYDANNKVVADFMVPYFMGAASTREQPAGISLPSDIKTEAGPGNIVVQPVGKAVAAKKVSAKKRKATVKKTRPGDRG